MRSTLLIRSALTCAVASAALAAQAVNIGLSSVGTFNNTANPVLFTETVLNQQGGFGPLTTYTASFNVSTSTATASYTGAGGQLDLAMTLDGYISQGISQTVYGKWVVTGGTGTYAGVTGSGTYAVVADVSNVSKAQDSYTTMRGNLEAVPEPASLGALALGAGALLRRRRKA